MPAQSQRDDVHMVSMLRHVDFLQMFSDYVAGLLERAVRAPEDHTTRPVSFDDWLHRNYWDRRDQFTDVVRVELSWETAAGGQLTGAKYAPFDLRIPRGIVDERGQVCDVSAFQDICRRFAKSMHCRLPSVIYRGERMYHWTWNDPATDAASTPPRESQDEENVDE